MYLKKQVQIQDKAQIRALIFDDASIIILVECFNYNNVFLVEYVVELSKHTRMNNYSIKLKEGKQLSFSPIYSLEPIELETLKTYIKTNLANDFIYSFKSSTRVPIFFD